MKEAAELYFNPREPGSYAGASTFAKHHKSKRKPSEWLKQYPAYTMHKTARQHFKRNRVVVSGLDHLWQCDLSDLSGIAKYNKNYKFLLFCIDVLSKYLWIVPLKSKTGDALVTAFQYILTKSKRKPLTVQSDQGTEFFNFKFRKLLKKNNIKLYHTYNSETKASIVERVQRTIKGRMWRYFTHKNTYKYIDVLQDIVHSYNNTYHRTIKTKPALVTPANAQDIWDIVYADLYNVSPHQDSLQKGDKVRILTKKLTFQKGYQGQWSGEIFKITKRITRHPAVYQVEDLMGELIEGTFYQEELQKVDDKQDVFLVDKILKTRQRKKHPKEYFVSWKFFPSKFNSWVTDLRPI